MGTIFLHEIAGTAILLLLGVGVVANVVLTKTKGNGGGWLLISFGWGLGVFAGVYVAAATGAHLNPAVTVGLLVSGAGVGLALPTILASATADLPPARAATGSAVVNMSRQIGSVLGVSILIALLGTPVGYPALRSAFDDVRWTLTAASLLAAAAAIGMTVRTPSTPQATAVPEEHLPRRS